MHPWLGLASFQARKLANALGFTQKLAADASKLMVNLYKVFTRYDASLVEVNPLVVTKDGQLLAIDAKITFDDNAMFRHPEDVEAAGR